MKKILFLVLLLALAVSLSACGAFLEDYNYSPLGSTSTGST